MVASLLAVAVVAEFSLRSLQSFLFQHIGQHTVTDIRHDLFKHVTSLKMSYFDRTPQGMLTSRLTSDLESLNDSFATGVVTLIADVLTIIGILTAMLFLSVELTVITLIITRPCLCLSIFVENTFVPNTTPFDPPLANSTHPFKSNWKGYPSFNSTTANV